MLGEQESAQERIHRYAQTCELIFEQPISFYYQQLEKKYVPEIDFDRYHIMITGLPRQVYRPTFGTDAFAYSRRFKDVEIEVVQMLEKQGVRCMSTMLLYDHTKRFCMIFNKPENISTIDVAQIASGSFNRLNAQIFDMNRTHYRNYTVVSDEISGYENLPQAFKKMDLLSRQQYFDMRTMVMTPSLLESVRIGVDPEQIHEDLIKMYVAMRAGEAEEMLERYRAVMAQIEKARDFHLLEDTLASMRRTLEGILLSHGVEIDPGCRDVFSIEKHPTFQIQRDAIEAYLASCMHSLSNTRPMSHLIQEAVRYIRHHYAENIAVSDVAEHIGMSQSWLTKRFKQECGTNIVGYLLDVRIERAKALLAQTDMLIMEIACSTGFDNPGYFISVFRRAAGMTPKAYREMMQENA